MANTPTAAAAASRVAALRARLPVISPPCRMSVSSSRGRRSLDGPFWPETTVGTSCPHPLPKFRIPQIAADWAAWTPFFSPEACLGAQAPTHAAGERRYSRRDAESGLLAGREARARDGRLARDRAR